MSPWIGFALVAARAFLAPGVAIAAAAGVVLRGRQSLFAVAVPRELRHPPSPFAVVTALLVAVVGSDGVVVAVVVATGS